MSEQVQISPASSSGQTGSPPSVSPAPAPAAAKASTSPPPVSRGSLARLAIPLLAVLAAFGFVALATLRWDEWVGAAVIQTTNDAYVRADTTRLSSRVAGEVLKVAVNDFQRVKVGDLLVQIDPADYEAQVAQAEAGVAAAQAAFDNLANQIELQYATIAQGEAQQVSAQAQEVEARQEQERQQSLTQTEAGTRQKLEQATAGYARAQADVLASLNPAMAHYMNGRIAEKNKDIATAEREYRAAIEASHGGAHAWLNLALSYRHQDRLDEMEQALRTMESRPLDRPESLMDGGSIVLRTGRDYALGIELVRKYLSGPTVEEGPAFKAHYIVGQLLEKQGDRPAAAQEYRAALALAREYTRAQEALKRAER